MARRKVDVPARISMTIPANLLAEIDRWKNDIENMSRSELIAKLVRYALDNNAIDKIYPEGGFGDYDPLLIHRGEDRTRFHETENHFQRTPQAHPEPDEVNILNPRPDSSNRASPTKGLPPREEVDRRDLIPPFSGPKQEHLGGHQPNVTPSRNSFPYPRPTPTMPERSETSSSWTIHGQRNHELNDRPQSDGNKVISPDEFFERVTRLHERIQQI